MLSTGGMLTLPLTLGQIILPQAVFLYVPKFEDQCRSTNLLDLCSEYELWGTYL